MTDTNRCEPPPETAPWTHHWIGPANGDSEPWLWSDSGPWFRGAQFYTPEGMAARGWVYSAPATPPQTVAALVEALKHADLQLEYIDQRSPSGTTPAVRAQIRAALALYRGEAGR